MLAPARLRRSSAFVPHAGPRIARSSAPGNDSNDDVSNRSSPATEHTLFITIQPFISDKQIEQPRALLRLLLQCGGQLSAETGAHFPKLVQLQFGLSSDTDQLHRYIRRNRSQG